MAIPDSDMKILWGRAAGICSNPACRTDLTALVASGANYNIGEMAHVVSKSPNGPVGRKQGGSDKYDNLILLCPNCHTRIDKASEQYPEEKLHGWKKEHETDIRSRGLAQRFNSVDELKSEVSLLLLRNKSVWSELGPKSESALEDPHSNLQTQWVLRKLDTILPNNLRIINLIDANRGLLGRPDLEAFEKFRTHALAFEQNQYDRLDKYPLFPADFAERFER